MSNSIDLEVGAIELLTGLSASFSAEYNVNVFASVGSTITVAEELIDGLTGEEELSQSLIVALEQTAGLGRHDRVWTSPYGGMYLTIVKPIEFEQDKLPLISLCTALAVKKALSTLGTAKLKVKWPNDIIGDEGKYSGILLKSKKNRATNKQYLIIGVGANLFSPSAKEDSFSDNQAYLINRCVDDAIDIEQIIGHAIFVTLKTLASDISCFIASGFDFAQMQEQYNESMAYTSENVCVYDPITSELRGSGVLQGVDSNGHLILLNDEGTFNHTSGELTLRKNN